MNAKDLAALLNGREYRYEITKNEEAAAKAAGLVVVFGASDDLMEFRGAIYDELGCYDGGTALVDAKGLIPERKSIDSDDDDALQDYFTRKPQAKTIDAVWDTEGYSWIYRTDIPHETFEIFEDGEPYCRGIVFALADVIGAQEAAQQEGTEGRLTSLVRAFVEKHRISCPEVIYQTDNVIVDAYGLIQGLVDVVGYHQEAED